ncbi:MAG: magnesium/cobalt transporter CorA [Cyanobacteria bacterium]|nr:magnesium/cobalt transporter CorA [Cyanobacteria bacterium CG_2015-16_32_12]NCO77854.1 magnesium/cobalt transporter CorA [Cyanobacteria bacterium CG_2015-22_32_23]NCQ05855.1 magnesium/cobalt transporter CorA [Cyanobacteria bacterium CG_2015-09_32_10]NCQ41692.1 magnesium/cobalt transporter CorA [Cyanobacteria bacterium CG_2015-04_32_10]NCS84279.1 magnesium/cobalt transporter CorA [Cyanobacteria bacterium CG_2015-02_32_10]
MVSSDFSIEEQEEEEEDYFDYSYDVAGTEPGSITIDPLALPSRLTLIEYDENNAYRRVNTQPKDCVSCLTNNLISWANIEGLGTENILREVEQVFQLHPLILEDVVSVPQRPKIEDYPDQLLIILHSIKPNKNEIGFTTEQISFILGKNYLLTFQEDEIEDFTRIIDRIRLNQGKVRQLGADYLAYLLLDTLIDNYFPVLEDYGERIEDLEDQIVLNPSKKTLQEIYNIRRELLALRRSIWPLRNLFNELTREDNNLITKEVYVYFRDCYYHTIQILDILETYRELASSLMDVLISSMSNKMNEVITLLTIISSIFIPLTFIAGLYGMNFEYMPELKWRWGYFGTLFLMLLIAGGMTFYFWRRGWFKLFLQK